MTFYSDVSIKKRLTELFPEEFNEPINLSDLDEAASFVMRLGREAFLSGEKKLVRLNPKNPFLKIAPGDLAILLVKEYVRIPPDLIGFISVKLRYTNMGLINISGFHVDPGFEGHLTFSVYNAGPNDIVLRYDDELFLIFFAELDDKTTSGYNSDRHSHQYQDHIPSDAMNKLGGKSVSPQSLDVRLGTLENRFQLVWALLLALTTGTIIVILRAFLGK